MPHLGAYSILVAKCSSEIFLLLATNQGSGAIISGSLDDEGHNSWLTSFSCTMGHLIHLGSRIWIHIYNCKTLVKAKHLIGPSHGLLFIWTELLSNFFLWSAHMRREFGDFLVSVGCFFGHDPCLFGMAEIHVILGLNFERNDDLINSFWIYLTFSLRAFSSRTML